jgi:D-lactate dehydrogenase
VEGVKVRVAIFSAQSYERTLLDELNAGHRHELVYFDTLLGPGTASLAAGFPAVSVIVNDSVTADVLKHLAAGGTTHVQGVRLNHTIFPPAETRAIA